MKKDVLRFIKNDMWEVRHNKRYLQASLKTRLAQIESDRKEALSENNQLGLNREVKMWSDLRTNEVYDRRRTAAIVDEYERWHNDQSYYLIYKDGSDVCITAEDILGGEPFPKMSDIVYAEMFSADDWMDTEVGDLDWYSDESLKNCDWNYEVEDERRWQYETAIQYKFGTAWSIRHHWQNPEFVPMEI